MLILELRSEGINTKRTFKLGSSLRASAAMSTNDFQLKNCSASFRAALFMWWLSFSITIDGT